LTFTTPLFHRTFITGVGSGLRQYDRSGCDSIFEKEYMSEISDGVHPAPTPDASGQGDRRNQQRKNRNAHNRDRRNVAHRNEEKTGKIAELKGFVYDVTSGNPAESFQRTTENIAEYVARTVSHGSEYRTALVQLQLEELVKPARPVASTPGGTVDQFDVEEWKAELKKYNSKLEAREENQGTVFSIILGQCTNSMRDQLRAEPTWNEVDEKSDVIGLLKLIQSNSNVKQPRRFHPHHLFDAQKEFLTFTQGSLSVTEYYNAFKDRLEHLERLCGPIGQDEIRVNEYIRTELGISGGRSSASRDDVDRALAGCREQYIATIFLFNANRDKYGGLQRSLENNYLVLGIPYPSTLIEAHKVLIDFIPEPSQSLPNRQQTSAPVFVQNEEQEVGNRSGRGSRGGQSGAGRGRSGGYSSIGRGGPNNNSTNNNTTPTINANNTSSAGGNNHSSENNTSNNSVNNYSVCTSYESHVGLRDQNTTVNSRKQEAKQNPITAVDESHKQCGITLHQGTLSSIPRNWIVLDSASSVDLFVNSKLLHDIRESPEPLTIVSNTGTTTIHRFGYIPGYPEKIWYHPDGAANVLSLRNVAKHFRVTFDTHDQNCITVHVRPEVQIRFHPSPSGLYRCNHPNHFSGVFSFLNTVPEKKAAYTQRGIQQAQLARRVQDIIMRPPARRFMEIVSKNLIRNCPVERRHILAAEDIYGPNIGSLQGKTPRTQVGHVTATTTQSRRKLSRPTQMSHWQSTSCSLTKSPSS
jgi:hypothetical protein